MKRYYDKFHDFWAEEKSLTTLLIILLIEIFIFIPFGQNSLLHRFAFLVFYFILLYAGLFILPINKKLRVGLIVLMAIWVLVVSGFLYTSQPLEIFNNVFVVLYCILLCWIVLTKTFSEGPVTFHRIQGAIVAYLLISFIFALVYHSIFLIGGDEVFKSAHLFNRKEAMYFSLTTLTTVGYGDITPAVAATKTLANLEALVGQLYPTILIARLVSMEIESSRKR